MTNKIQRMFAIHTITGAIQIPVRKQGKFVVAKGGNKQEYEKLVDTLDEVHLYQLDGYSLRLAEGGKGRGSLRCPAAVNVVR